MNKGPSDRSERLRVALEGCATADDVERALQSFEVEGGRQLALGEDEWSVVAQFAPALPEVRVHWLCLSAPTASARVLENRRLGEQDVLRVQEKLLAHAEGLAPARQRQRAIDALWSFAAAGRIPAGSEGYRFLLATAKGNEPTSAAALRALVAIPGVPVAPLKSLVYGMADEDERLAIFAYASGAPVEVLHAVLAVTWRPAVLHALAHNPTARRDSRIRDLLRSFGSFQQPSVLAHLAKDTAGIHDLRGLLADALRRGEGPAIEVLDEAPDEALAQLRGEDLRPLLESTRADVRLATIRAAGRAGLEKGSAHTRGPQR